MIKSIALISVLHWACCLDVLTAADTWPEWRGPEGQGHSAAVNLPIKWSETQNVQWKTTVTGLGWSTPVIADGRIWLTTATDVRASEAEAERRRKLSTNSQPLIVSDSVSLRAVCVDLQTGKVLHDVEVMNQQQPQMIHVQNTYATPTPILADGRLYCHYGPSGMACLDTATTKVLWTNRDLDVAHENGPGSSPILWNDLLIVHCDGIDVQYIVAINKDTGKTVWKTDRTGELNKNPQLRKSYATPLVAELNGAPQLISPAADWVYGYDPADGTELWRLNYGELGFSNSARPVVGDGMIYICTGYLQSQMLAVRVKQQGDRQQAEIAWQFKRQVPSVSSPLLVDGALYFVSDKGIASCIDAKTSKTHWAQRIGSSFWSSPLYADGRIYFFGRDGVTTVVAASTTYEKLAENQLEGSFYATAAPVDGAMILRTDKALYRISASND